MKRVFITTLILSIALVSLSCSSDDDNGSSSATGVTINGEAFTGTIAQLLTITTTENAYSFTMSDASDVSNIKTITIAVQFPLKMSVTGDYAYPATGDRILSGISNYSTNNTTNASAMFEGTGTVTITDNGSDNYTLVFNMTMDDGVVVKGTFRDTFLTQ